MIAKEVKFRSMENPGIAIFDGVTYVIPGWHIVSNGTTLDEVKEHWEKITYGTPEKRPEKKYIVESIISQRTGEEYTVEFRGYEWTCSCAGFGFRRRCKHIEQVKQKYIK